MEADGLTPRIRARLKQLAAYDRAWRLSVLLRLPEVTDPAYIRRLGSLHDPRYRWGRN